jgi:hypothetical protein
MTSPPDVQNVPDVWGLLEQARNCMFDLRPGDRLTIGDAISTALAQRERFVLVPKEATRAESCAWRCYCTCGDECWQKTQERLATAPKVEEKP